MQDPPQCQDRLNTGSRPPCTPPRDPKLQVLCSVSPGPQGLTRSAQLCGGRVLTSSEWLPSGDGGISSTTTAGTKGSSASQDWLDPVAECAHRPSAAGAGFAHGTPVPLREAYAQKGTHFVSPHYISAALRLVLEAPGPIPFSGWPALPNATVCVRQTEAH